MSDLSTIFAASLTALSGALLLATDPVLLPVEMQPENSNSGASERGMLAPSFSRAGHLYLTAVIDGTEVDLMIDTGASQTVLSGADAKRLGINAERTVKVASLSGLTTLHEGKAGEITIAQTTFRDHTVLISQATDRSLLGMDILSQVGGGHLALTPHSQ